MDIRVITPVVPTGLTQPSDFEGILGPEDNLSYIEVEKGPASIETELDKALAAPETIARIIEAEAEGIEAVVIDCMCDPGLRPARECVTIPVVGPCEAAMNLACVLGQKFTVLTVTENMTAIFESQAKTYGAWEKFGSTRAIDIPVLELGKNAKSVARAMLAQSIAAIKEDGADVLIVGCTGMVGVAQSLQIQLKEKGYDLPVLDPIPLAVRLAKMLVQSGVSHSKVAYPAPRPKVIRGYEQKGLQKYQE